jgi:hypothetical protein
MRNLTYEECRRKSNPKGNKRAVAGGAKSVNLSGAEYNCLEFFERHEQIS